MPTVDAIDGLRVVIYFNGHRPAHVHVIGDGCEACRLNCPTGSPELRENYGLRQASFQRLRQLSHEFMRGMEEDSWFTVRKKSRQLMNGLLPVWEGQPRWRRRVTTRRTGRVVIDLSSGLSIAFKPQDAQGFEHAEPEQLRKIEISPSGLGLHFPVIDADIYLPALLEGFLGSRRWMAARLGKVGGRVKSHTKTACGSRER